MAQLFSLGHFDLEFIMTKIPKQSYGWYVPIVVILLCGYLVGAALTFGIHFLGWIPQLASESGRFIVSMFGMGLLGATAYSTQYCAWDADQSLKDAKLLPHFLDVFFYAAHIVEGGIYGVVFFLALSIASQLAIGNHGSPTISPTAGFVVSFCGGLAQFKIHAMLVNIATKLSKGESKDEP